MEKRKSHLAEAERKPRNGVYCPAYACIGLINYKSIKMKRLLFFVALLPVLVSGQTITEGKSTLIYSLPKTEFVINATVELVTENPGNFYQYSERFLATSEVITAEKKYYRMKTITMETRTLSDSERTFTIIPSKKSLANQISVNDEGILCGINVAPSKAIKEIRTERIEKKENFSNSKLLPLSEEYMLAGSVAKMAEGAAKQIYRIRENRVDLLSGDVDNMPTDGASLKTMIAEMDVQEKELTKLFTGITTVETLTQTIVYTPKTIEKDEVVFRFSSHRGIVASDDLSGAPYYLNINFEPIKTVTNESKKPKKPLIEVFTILPVTAQVRLDDGNETLYEQQVTLPQFGILLPIPLETMDKYSKAYVSPENGRLLSIEQLPKK